MSATAKEQMQQVLDEAPDDVSYREVEYRIYLRRTAEEGLQGIRDGRVVEEEEAERRMARWIEEFDGLKRPS